MKNLFIIIVSIALLSGCAQGNDAERAAWAQQAQRPVYCKGKEDCEMKWGRVLSWTRDHSAYKINQATDMLISTMGPLPNDPRPAFTITKTAQGNGRYDISFDGGCDNMFGCIPSMLQLKADFANFVMAK